MVLQINMQKFRPTVTQLKQTKTSSLLKPFGGMGLVTLKKGVKYVYQNWINKKK